MVALHLPRRAIGRAVVDDHRDGGDGGGGERPKAPERLADAVVDGDHCKNGRPRRGLWCIDDRYPTSLDVGAVIEVVAGLDALDGADEVKLLRWKERLTDETVRVGGVPFAVQAPGSRHRGFWHHHFVRAGTLRRVFGQADLADSTSIHDVLKPLLPERRGRRSASRRSVVEAGLFEASALVPRRQLMGLGEPLVRGQLTRNGMEELRRWGCEIPPYPSLNRDVLYPPP